jgi:hypothetical protein
VKAVLRAMTKLPGMRDIGRQLVGQHIGEIILLGVAGEILERQHHDA